MPSAESEGRRSFIKKLILLFGLTDALFACCVLLWVSNYLFDLELSTTILWALFMLTLILFSGSILLVVNIWLTWKEIAVIQEHAEGD